MTVDINKFKFWLESLGAEVLPCTNEYELLRFKGSEVGVLYKSGKFSGQYVADAIQAFKSNSKWKGRPLRSNRKGGTKRKIQLIKRDGTKCFFCKNEMHEDITVEHLVPLSSGGKNSYSNMVLTHEACNLKAGNKTIREKIELIIEMRSDNN